MCTLLVQDALRDQFLDGRALLDGEVELYEEGVLPEHALAEAAMDCLLYALVLDPVKLLTYGGSLRLGCGVSRTHPRASSPNPARFSWTCL